MKKISNYSILIYLLMVAVIFLVGQSIFDIIDEYALLTNDFVANNNNRIPFMIVAIVISIVLATFIYEIGHALGAKIGKYKIIAVNLFGVLFYRSEGRLKVGFEGIDGFTEIGRAHV